MRHRLKFLDLLLIVVLVFSFTGCKATSKTIAETTEAVKITEAVETATTTVSTETTAAPETTTPPVQENAEYNIGDTGPAGGFIFYVNPNYATDGWRYLEASPSSSATSLVWYNGVKYVETGATATAIGTGMSNTQRIVDILGNESYAAKLCVDLTTGGYDDWFMPSKDELNLMYRNLHLKGIGNFGNYDYWSSSEITAFQVWVQYFRTGNQNNCSYGGGYQEWVRAVRAFN